MSNARNIANLPNGDDAPIYACRAWVNFDGTNAFSPNPSTSAINESGNVSSITGNGTGNYTVNFATAMPDSNYCLTLAVRPSSSGTNGRPLIQGTNYSTTSVNVQNINATDTAYLDPDIFNVAVFR